MDIEIKHSSPIPANSGKVHPAPTGPPTLTVQEVSYCIKERPGPWWKGACLRTPRTKTVLNNVSMHLKGGFITAIIGSSGSGKTSLLDVIAQRCSGKVSGKVLFRQHVCSPEVMRRHASYVMQADKLLTNLTVRETLTYTAYLKLPRATSKDNINKKVDEVLLQMGLRQVANTRIGGQITRGVSGGEKRRVTIAIQLLQNPEILLLDEPTTGLDSYTARHLVKNLAELAHTGQKIVVLTIHQPRSDIFRLLDQIAILAQGQLAFFGKTTELVPYFSDIGYPCPRYSNPLDRYIDLSSVDRRNSNLLSLTQKRVQKLVTGYKDSDLSGRVTEEIKQSEQEPQMTLPSGTKTSGPSLTRTVTTLVRRMTLNLSRDRQGFVNKIVLMPAFVIFIIVFLGRLSNNQESIQDRAGLLYQTVSVPTHVAVLNTAALFPCIRDVFYRECRDGLYSPATFMVAYTIHMLPFSIVASLLFSSMLYWIVGMSADPDKFNMYIAVVCLLYFAGEFLTVAAMGLLMDPQLVVNTTILIFTASGVLASGFLRAVPNMPHALKYLGYASIHKYGSEIVAANEFKDLNLTCDTSSQFVPCVFRDGQQYLAMAFPGVLDHMNRNFGVLAGMSFTFTILAYLAYKIRGIPNLQ